MGKFELILTIVRKVEIMDWDMPFFNFLRKNFQLYLLFKIVKKQEFPFVSNAAQYSIVQQKMCAHRKDNAYAIGNNTSVSSVFPIDWKRLSGRLSTLRWLTLASQRLQIISNNDWKPRLQLHIGTTKYEMVTFLSIYRYSFSLSLITILTQCLSGAGISARV